VEILMDGRLEYKYLVPNHLVDRIRSEVRPYMDVDPFAGKQSTNEYTVRSVYYDSPRLDCYYEKLDGVGVRRKFRIRGYNEADENSIVFLEIKRKYLNFITKDRAPLLRRDLNDFLSSPEMDKYIISLSGTAQEQADAKHFLFYYYRHGLQPTVLVVYDREAFLGRFDASLRITFDKNLRGAIFPTLDMLHDEERLAPAMRDHFILEVKFFRGALPSWAISMVQRYSLPRMALSKYTICLDAQRAPRAFSRVKTRTASPADCWA